ncbi:MAG: HAD-IA family hydrolase [Magnetococcales bacterium]|nr:HAD-IA family hydrolase [Magnetococcales bacterium]MBF0157292.1 HAD-IA family hydrolase [Magnetococcales bacterium]
MASLDPPWGEIDTLLLDMDGTLLDLHFDNVFFRDLVPRVCGERWGMAPELARERVLGIYGEVAGTLAWYDLNHLSRALGLELMPLKEELLHLMRMHPGVPEFLDRVRRSGRACHLVTNAHPLSLDLKLARMPIREFFTSVVTSHDLGHPKESLPFWPRLREQLGFSPERTLLIDDSEPVLLAAHRFGLGHLLHIASPSSRDPVRPSWRFPTVAGVHSLLPALPG